jgi:hypothetical protein
MDCCFRLLKTTYHKKHGADRICFTHHPSSILCSSKFNLEPAESLRYLSLYDNRCLRYFKGHKDRFQYNFHCLPVVVTILRDRCLMLLSSYLIPGLFHYVCRLPMIALCLVHLITVSEYGTSV